jgi:hypothetical protein
MLYLHPLIMAHLLVVRIGLGSCSLDVDQF